MSYPAGEREIRLLCETIQPAYPLPKALVKLTKRSLS